MVVRLSTKLWLLWVLVLAHTQQGLVGAAHHPQEVPHPLRGVPTELVMGW
jgi:hypothetical protein